MLKDDFFKDINYNRLRPEGGRVLISEPFLYDPFFKRTVVFLVEFDEEGALGFILNKPLKVLIHDIVEEFPYFQADVHFGGPVAEESLFYLHTIGEKLEGSKEVMPGLWWGSDFDQLKSMINTRQITPNDVRFFVGYSGWGEEQLATELEEQSWIVAETDAKQVMTGADEEFWAEKLKSMGSKFAIIANFPEDPSLN